MAQRHEPVKTRRGATAAFAVAAGISALAAVPLLALATAAEGDGGLMPGAPYVARVLRFTVLQATLSALIATSFAIPLALALGKRQSFTGRALLLRLFAVPLGLPQLVAVLGIIAVYGRQGILNDLLASLGFPGTPSVFGLGGILLAHVFFNLPLAVRFLLARLEAIPPENWRLAASLGFGQAEIFRHLEWPHMRMVLPGVFALIFMLCITSFTVVLTLGGGPHATTLEVAIYQALRFDLDPALAARLAALQIALCAGLLLILQRFSMVVAVAPALRVQTLRPDSGDRKGRLRNGIVILAGALFVALPIAGVLLDGARADFPRLLREPILWRAAGFSVMIAASAAMLATISAALLAAGIARSRGPKAQFLRMAGNLVLLVPPLILAAGWFLILYRHLDPAAFSPYAVIVINALMALPFALAVLEPSFRISFQMHDRLAQSLGLEGLARLRLVEWPALRSSLALAALVAVLASLGEFGVIAFFGSQDLITLPLLLYQRIGSYRFNDAAGIALLLLCLCLALSFAIERQAPQASRASSQ
jgi:thiamine transport system permease protein